MNRHVTTSFRIAGEALVDLIPAVAACRVSRVGNGEALLTIDASIGEAFLRAYQRRQIELLDAEFAALRADPTRPVRSTASINATAAASLINEVRAAQRAQSAHRRARRQAQIS